MVDSSAERAVYVERARAAQPADLQSRQQVGIVLFRRQCDGVVVLRGASAGNRIEVADHEIGVDAEGSDVVEAAVRGDDEGVIRNRRGLIVIIACAEDHAGAGIVGIHTRECSRDGRKERIVIFMAMRHT